VNISQAGIDLIKRFESCRLTAYQDKGGVWTIGWGHTGSVNKNDTCTQDQADAWLLLDLRSAERCIQNCVAGELAQNQFDALCSFIYNVGCAAFSKSTLLHMLNAGDDTGAANEFKRWDHDNGKVLADLTMRREKEREVFLA
jgi:lysozyme